MKNFAAAFFCLWVWGCAAPGPALPPVGPAECGDKKSCDLQWQRAQLWIANNAAWRIQMANDVIIQTYNPAPHDPKLAYTVTRENRGNGSATISARAFCDNIFLCVPNQREALERFYAYIQAVEAP